MGKLAADGSPYRQDAEPESVPLHNTPGPSDYDDDVPDISPPAYEDNYGSEPGPSTPFLPPNASQRVEVSNTHTTFLNKPINVVKGSQNLLDSRCDADPKYLEEMINQLGWEPPSPTIHIVGTHRETFRKDNKTETRHITDFRITLNMRDYLIPPTGTQTWRPPLHLAENGEKALRGGFRATRAPGYKAELEVGSPKPTLKEWCHRYCASGSYLKTFRLTRQVTGFDRNHFKTRLEGLIRGTGYRGSLSITFPVESQYVDISSSNRINQWRFTTWIRWIFYLTFLWIFTWPYLYFATKRYAVVTAEWPFSKVDAAGNKIYATCTEEQWIERFALAVQQLALDRYQGEPSYDYLSQVLSRPDCGSHHSNHHIPMGYGGPNSAFGVLQSGLRIAHDINRSIQFGNSQGWGYDT